MTDWDKELAKIDKQLASMSDADLLGEQARPALPAGKAAPAPTRQSSKAPAPAADDSSDGGSSGFAKFMLYARVTLAAALGIGMMFWPYEAKCGSGMMLYLAAVAVVVVSGTWSAVWSWRHRAAPDSVGTRAGQHRRSAPDRVRQARPRPSRRLDVQVGSIP